MNTGLNPTLVTVHIGAAMILVGLLVWITVGNRFGRRRKLFTAIIDSATVKRLADVSHREIDRENPEMRTHEELADFLTRIYDRPVCIADTVTVIHFSPVSE